MVFDFSIFILILGCLWILIVNLVNKLIFELFRNFRLVRLRMILFGLVFSMLFISFRIGV